MSQTQPKYRPQLTLAELETIAATLYASHTAALQDNEYYIDSLPDTDGKSIAIPLEIVEQTLRKVNTFIFKAKVGMNAPAYVTQRPSAGRPSNNDLIKESFAKEIAERNTQSSPAPLKESFSPEEIAYNKYVRDPESCTLTEKEMAVEYKSLYKKDEVLTAEELRISQNAVMRSIKGEK